MCVSVKVYVCECVCLKVCNCMRDACGHCLPFSI